jgi:hypothetical protein
MLYATETVLALHRAHAADRERERLHRDTRRAERSNVTPRVQVELKPAPAH